MSGGFEDYNAVSCGDFFAHMILRWKELGFSFISEESR